MRRSPAPALLILSLIGCNEPPGAPEVGISPEAPTTLDALTAQVLVDSVDPNKNDTVEYTYAWSVDGQVLEDLTSAEVPADRTTRGEIWTVTVTPMDDKESGPAGTASVTVVNALPSATVSLTPGSPLSTDDLTAVPALTDPDGDTVATTVSWTVDGAPAGISGLRVPADRTRPRQSWEVTVVPRDARGDGEATTASVVIENQAPVIDLVRLRPSAAFEASRITAQIVANDMDGDDINYTPTWAVNGIELLEISAMELTGEHFDKGDTVTLSVVASDGFSNSAPVVSEDLPILNTPPRLAGATVDPASPVESDTLSCLAEGWADDDGDPEGYEQEWLIEGTVISTNATVDGADFRKGDRVTCRVTPFDGTDQGLPMTARPVTIGNTPPAIADVVIGPTDPVTGTEITSTVGTVTDVDGDTVRLDTEWYVNGARVLTGPSLPGTAYFRGQTLQAWVTPFDGDEYGAVIKSNVLTAQNSPPRIVSARIDPEFVYSDTGVGVAMVTEDLDKDTITLRWVWTVNGSSYGTTSTTSIPASALSVGDTYSVTITPNDSVIDGTSVTLSGKVLNPPPSGHVVAIDPEEPTESDDLLCEITTSATDIDGDAISYTFSWEVDGSAWSGATTKTTYAGDTISNTDTKSGESWECFVEASDGGSSTTESAVADITGGNVSYRAGYYWVKATYNASSTDHSAICSAEGLKATGATVTLTWDSTLLSDLSKDFGYTSAGDTNNSAQSMWCWDGTSTAGTWVSPGECETHNFGTSYNNYGSYGSNSNIRPVFTCTK